MKFNYSIPSKIKEFINNADLKEISIGCSDSQVIRINKEKEIYYLKIMKQNMLLKEYNSLTWLQKKLPVPEVILFIQEDENDYLITREISGKMLCDDYYIENPDKALSVLKQAFSSLYLVDIKDCPFNVANDYKLSLVRKNVENGLVQDSSLKNETLEKFGSVKNLLKYLEDNRFDEELVFSHGDTSLPNIFANDKEISGFIDVGECGIADKWFDLAICEKSILRNYGPEYVKKFYEVLKIKRDENKINYYLLMMELYL